MASSTTIFTCPVCAEPLTTGPSVANCSRNHTFDRAREGYFNLLLANQKGSNDPGDDRESVTARRELLASGCYEFLSVAIDECVRSQGIASGVIADMGCGEGSFLNRLAKVSTNDTYGIDISKSAIRLAARTYATSQFAITNIARQLPIADNSCDILINVMAPRNTEEFKRVLKPNGCLLVVVPGDSHLRQITDQLMAHEADQSKKPETATLSLAPSFQLTTTTSVKNDFIANQKTLQNLVTMTPLRWKSQRKSLQDFSQLDHLEVTADFQLLQYTLA